MTDDIFELTESQCSALQFRDMAGHHRLLLPQRIEDKGEDILIGVDVRDSIGNQLEKSCHANGERFFSNVEHLVMAPFKAPETKVSDMICCPARSFSKSSVGIFVITAA